MPSAMHPALPHARNATPSRPWFSLLSATLFGAITAMTSLAAHAQTPQWPDTYLSRLQVQALIETANAEILASDSATLSLEKWCGDHHLIANPKLIATQVHIDKAPSAEQRQRLQVGPDEPIRYRRVQLSCDGIVLSEADNWYVPSRLTPEMNQQLDTTNTPFGKAVLALKPFRRTYAAAVLWSPLPPQWEMLKERPAGPGPDAKLILPAALFEHRALVFGQDLRPISEVIETYQKGLLAFPPPPQ